MPNPADLVLDAWTALSHKSAIGDSGAVSPGAAPTWPGRTHQRRLNVYLLLTSYLKNASRYWLRTSPADPERWLQHREYGDSALMVQTIRAAVMGGTPRPLVDGAEDELPQPPTPEDIRMSVLPAEVDRPRDSGEPPDDRAPDVAAALAEARAEWETDKARIDAATARQEWLDGWWDNERASMKVIEGEDDAVGLGDGVYELVVSKDKGRVRLRVYDPGFYFPVWADDAQGDDFPERAHLAWDFEDDAGERFVRRITYERRRLTEFDDTGTPTGTRATRRYPYDPDIASEWTVVKTDATWPLKALQTSRRLGVDLFSLDGATVAVNEDGEPILELDLNIDFIPLVHVPNTSAIKELWGESALLRVAQIVDDLMSNDTDMAVSAALVAAPAITISGSAPAGAAPIETYGPGQVFRTGDGVMGVLDNSRSLDALIKMQDRLLERLSVVRQLPASVLGRVDLSNQLAGITLLLSFGPFRQYVEDLRLPRRDKYGLLLKFVQRMSIAAEFDGIAAPVLDANLAFGPFLPVDEQAAVALIVQLINAKVVSRATGMRMAQEAGIPIDSIEDELDAVAREDFEGGVALANATGSEEMAADYLRRPLPEPPAAAPPTDTGPPAPGTPPPVPGGPGDDVPPVPLP